MAIFIFVLCLLSEFALGMALGIYLMYRKGVKEIMATLDEILDVVRPLPTKVDGLKAILDGIKQQLADALAGTVTPEMQAKIDEIFENAKAGGDKIQAAIDENTVA